MTLKELVKIRKQAEKAVSEMPDGELKVKAFEVVFNHLLSGAKAGGTGKATATTDQARTDQPPLKAAASSRSASGRILVLRDEGFFSTPRTIGEIRDELGAHGWHYPLTSLSGTLMDLVGEKRELRRQRIKHGGKQVWKYSNR
jgi:hypothetical protein